MIDVEHYQDKDQEYILSEIKKLSAKIVAQQKIADTEGFKTYGGALGLADLRRDRALLYSFLKPFSLVK